MNIKFNKKEKQIFINRYLSGVLIESITADIGIVHSTLYSLINNLKKKIKADKSFRKKNLTTFVKMLVDLQGLEPRTYRL